MVSDNQLLKADFLLDNAYNVGYPALPMDVGEAKAKMYAFEYRIKKMNSLIGNFRTKIYFNSIYHLMDDSERDSLFLIDREEVDVTDTVFMKMDMPGWSKTLGFYAEAYLSISEKSKLYFKVDNYYNQSKAEMTMFMTNPNFPGEPPMFAETWPGIRRNVSGLYIENSTYFTESFNLKLNARADFSQSKMTSDYGKQQFSVFGLHIKDNYNHLLKSFNLIGDYSIQKSLGISIGMGYAERLPSVTEQFGFYLYNAQDGYDYIGKPGILPEKSQHVNLEIRYLGDKLNASFKNHFNYLTDYILGVYDSNIPKMNLYASGTKVYTNISNVKMFSCDILLQWKPIEILSFVSILKYTFAETSYGTPLPQIPPLKSIVSIKLERKNWMFLAENEMAAKQIGLM